MRIIYEKQFIIIYHFKDFSSKNQKKTKKKKSHKKNTQTA